MAFAASVAVKNKKKYLLSLACLLAGLIVLLAIHRVPQRITTEDRVYLRYFLEGVPAVQPVTYEQEVRLISAIQQAVLAHAPLGDPIPERQPREPRQLWETGHGACYDISRTLEKAMRYRRFRTRHVALYFDFWDPEARSHAVTEVRTEKGWLVVENTAPWLALDTQGLPYSFSSLSGAISWQTPPPAKVAAFYSHPVTLIYGLYSRHGRFYPPYTPVPDWAW